MKFLVTDCHGCIGARLIPALLEAGHEVVGLAAPGAAEPEGLSGATIWAWPARADALVRALAGIDVVYALDLGGITSDSAAATARQLTLLMASAAKASCPNIVLLSRAEVYDPDLLANTTVRETSALQAVDDAPPVAAAALAAEAALQAHAPGRWSVLRCPKVLAADSGPAKDLFRSILLEDARSPDRFHGVDAQDVVRALVALPGAARAADQVFNIAAPQALDDTVLDRELGRLARLLNDEASSEDKLRPAYDLAPPVMAADKLTRLVGVSAEKPVWISLAETLQQLMKDLRAEGALDPLPEKINMVAKAVETGAKPLAGRVAVVTGCTSGIGRATCRLLSRLGATVVGVARNAERGAALMAELADDRHMVPGHFLQADLMSFAQIRALAADLSLRFPRIDILINNAGANFTSRRLTEDGYEATFALNHLAPFLLTNLLAAPLQAAEAARIIMVSSDWHRRSQPDMLDLQMESGYRPVEAYCRAKFLNLQITYVMAALLDGTGVTVNAIHPGVVRTGISTRNADSKPLPPTQAQAQAQARERAHQRMISPEFSAMYLATLAASPEYAGKSGLYLDTDEIKTSHEATYDEDWAWQIWELTARMTGLAEQPATVEA